ncbi:PR domain zinc finger protein 12 like protein [Argiope bruennichi]|uniref:PR domain zinc finger protein 12 like protein n=1 Tax=Argiope bruennichi TaxID=94029 RepID=A0A8T0DZJ7_ARGBR|nr:PR domain zinc finger protein 12 like protein [Argiope bruennichi]
MNTRPQMERGNSENVLENIPSETKIIPSQTRPLEGIYIDDTVLHRVLYGQWPEWNGHRPSEKDRQRMLQTIPVGVLRNVPEEVFLDVSTLPQQGVGVFAKSPVEERTIIGPLPGRLLSPTACTREDLDNAWEAGMSICLRQIKEDNIYETAWQQLYLKKLVLFIPERLNNTSYRTISDECGQIKHVLVVKRSMERDRDSWITLIQTARYTQEQNLETFEANGAIYYRAIKSIQAGEELLVWYGHYIEHCFGLPCFESRKIHKKCLEETSFPEEERKKAKCVICHKGFNSRSNLRSHMRTHTQQKPFKCDVCQRRFSQSSTLRNHTRLHTGEKPYKCSTCRSSYSQLAGLRAHQKSSQHQPKLHLPEM